MMTIRLFCCVLLLLHVLPTKLAAADYHQLDISLIRLDPGLPEDKSTYRELDIFPEVREAEANYMPYVLRHVLVESGQWGAVRVLQQPEPGVELLISGTIIQSDGLVLELDLQAVDASGRSWINKRYRGTTSEQDYAEGRDQSRPLFIYLYQQIAADLNRRGKELGDGYLQDLRQIAQLKHAQNLAPDAFEGYLELDDAQHWQLRRLPADNDPMFQRTSKIREHEYLFIDTVDQQYAELYDEMTPSYDLWRRLNREQVAYEQNRGDYLEQRDTGKKGSYESMRKIYNAYKWSKIEEQEMAALASGLNNELSPTLVELDNRLVELDGTLIERYQEWQRILREMFLLENGEI